MKKIILIVLLIVMSNMVYAQENHYGTDVTIIIQRQIYYENLIYLLNFRGIDEFVGLLKIEKPNVYEKLRPNYEAMKSKKKKATIMTYASIGIGAGLAGYGIYKLNQDTFDMTGIALISGGMGFGIVSTIIVNIIFLPKEDDLIYFINLHNRINDTQAVIK